jgi:hypothetical protein
LEHFSAEASTLNHPRQPRTLADSYPGKDANAPLAKMYPGVSDERVGALGSVPAKYKDLESRLREADRKQEELNRQVKAAITICHC